MKKRRELLYKNTVKKWVLEKRSELYLRFYKNAEEICYIPLRINGCI